MGFPLGFPVTTTVPRRLPGGNDETGLVTAKHLKCKAKACLRRSRQNPGYPPQPKTFRAINSLRLARESGTYFSHDAASVISNSA
jgi:hypothetical protein